MKETTQKKLPAVKVRPSLDIASKLKYEILSDKKVNLTRARAFEFLELDTFQGERAVNEAHVQFLYNQWSSGRFMWEHVLIGVCLYKDKYYRINGQHTCWLRVNIDEDFFVKIGFAPQVREITYKVESEEALRGLYATFDQNKIRTHGHMVRALLIGTNCASDIWPSIISKLGQSMRLWLFQDKHERKMVSANDISEVISSEHADVFKVVGLFLQQHYDACPFARRAACIAAMFATFSANPNKAPDFWNPVFTGLKLEVKGDPRYQLRAFMQSTRQSMEGKFKAISAEDAYRVCILAWNKWRKGDICGQSLRSTEKRLKASK